MPAKAAACFRSIRGRTRSSSSMPTSSSGIPGRTRRKTSRAASWKKKARCTLRTSRWFAEIAESTPASATTPWPTAAECARASGAAPRSINSCREIGRGRVGKSVDLGGRRIIKKKKKKKKKKKNKIKKKKKKRKRYKKKKHIKK